MAFCSPPRFPGFPLCIECIWIQNGRMSLRIGMKGNPNPPVRVTLFSLTLHITLSLLSLLTLFSPLSSLPGLPPLCPLVRPLRTGKRKARALARRRSYWLDIENRRRYFIDLAGKLGIDPLAPHAWADVTVSLITAVKKVVK